MSAIGPGSFRVGTELVLDLDKFRAEMKKAVKEANSESETIGQKIRKGFRTAADAAIAMGFTVEGIKKAYDLVTKSVERLAARGGENDPAVRAFRDIRQSALDLFDTLVRSTLSSGTMQSALQAVTDVVVDLTGEAGKLGRWIDKFTNEHAGDIAVAALGITTYFESLANAFDVMRGSFDLAAGAVVVIVGETERFVRDLPNKLRLLFQLTMGEGEKAREQYRQSAEELNDYIDKITERGRDLAVRGMAAAMGGAERISDSISRMIEQIPELAQRIRDEVAKNAVADPEPPGTFGFRADREKVVIQGLQTMAQQVEATFAGMTSRLGDMFTRLAETMVSKTEEGTRGIFQGIGSTFQGLSALGAQVEAAFGRSSAAARIFAKVQLGLQAVMAGVRAAEETAEASSALANKDYGAAALHFAAATAFTGASALAGGRAVGAIGPGSTGSSSGFGSAGSSVVNIGDTVERQPVKIEVNFYGHVLTDDEYIQDELVPRLRRAVEERDVVITSSHSQQLGNPGAAGVI